MSFNRGMKRDSFGNRNFNNRPIGGGGMNPWEGGMMPGRGILPTPSNNLSLASPQAQLAIASNLLSNLLRSQQETQPQVPSLLSLGNAFGGPGPNFRSQQNFIPGRFNDRQIRRPLDNRRPEPYNKMGNRARDGPAGRRGPSAQQSRAAQSGNQRINGNQNQHRNDKSSKPIPASKQNQTAKKEQQDVKTSDNEKAETPVVKSDEIEESEEKKRDWKDEKKEGEATQSGKTEKTDASKDQQAVQSDTADAPKEGDSSVSENEPKTPGKKSAARHAESRYADVPMNKMVCHVCNKHMWDGYSFENHLRGRAHLLMMDKLDESYKLKVDLMRHELRVAEEQRELSLSNSKRRGKKVSVDLNVREYCTMCDLNFYGTLSTHRKSEKHQQLKTFLHPRCFSCMKEFPSRIEYDEHCLTPLHMKTAVQSEEQRKNKKKDKLAKGESEVRSAEEEEKESVATELKADKDEELPENAEYLTDIVENVTDPKYKIPSFKHCRQNQLLIGKSMVKEVQGYHCEKCRRFMLTSEDMTLHLRSINHYRIFVQEIKTLISSAENADAKPTEETEGSEKDTSKDTSKDNEEYEGNWKRRKVAHSEDEDAPESKEAQEPNDATADEAKKVPEGDDKYDPMEADVESEDEGNRDEEENQLLEGTENQHDEEKKSTDEKMWADIDNDNDLEIGNLLDEIADEKDATEDGEESPKKEGEKVADAEAKAPRGRGTPRSRGNRARRSRR